MLSRALAVALLVVLSGCGRVFVAPVTQPVVDWEYRWGDAPPAVTAASAGPWQALTLPDRPAGRGEHTNLWLRTRLPAETVADPTLYLPPVDEIFEAVLDGRRIYAFGTLDAGGAGRFEGWPSHLVRLPAGYAGKTLYLRVHSKHFNIGPSGTPRFGTHADVVTYLMYKNLSQLVIGIGFVLAGVFSLFLVVGSRAQRREFVLFAAFSLFIGAYLIARDELRSFLPLNPLGMTYFEMSLLWFGAASFVAFSEHVFGSSVRGFERWLTRTFIAVWAVLAALVGTGALSLSRALIVQNVLIDVTIPVVAFSIVKKALAGDRDARVFAGGVVVLAVLGGFDLAGGLGLIEYHFVAQWGFLGMIMAFGVMLARRYVEAMTQLERLNAAYERFVPQEFLTLLNKTSITEVKLGDHSQREMTILFCNIRSFTALSESMSPADNFRFLNSYLTRVSPVIREHHGFIDKYIGDGIMALFPSSPADAVRAAVAMLEVLDEYNTHRWKSGYAPIQVGIGIHCGPLILGTIGHPAHMQGTVIADAVNLASRLEGLTKVYGAPIVVSERVRETLSGVETRRLGLAEVKGKKTKVSVHAVVLPPRVLAGLVLAAVVGLTGAGCTREPAREATQTIASWEYRWGDEAPWSGAGEASAAGWAPLELPDRPPGGDGRRNVWLRTRLPKLAVEEPTLYVPAVDTIYELYTGRERIFSYGRFDAHGRGTFVGWNPRLVELPPGYADRWLYLRLYSDHINIGPSGVPRLGGARDVQWFVLSHNVSQLLIGWVFILTGLGAALLTLALRGRAGFRREYAAFALFCVMLGTYLLARNELRAWVYADALVAVYVEGTTLWLGSAALVAFCEYAFGSSFAGFERRLWKFFVAALPPVALAVGMGWISFTWALVAQSVMLVVSLPLVFASVVRKALRGNLEARMFTTGLSVFTVFAALDFFGSVGLAPFLYLAQWGFLALLLSLAYILSARYLRITRHLVRLNEAYERFVPREFLTLMGKSSIVDVELGDHSQREMTVLFSDIRDFTALSESMSPADNFRFLNSYLKRVGPVVRANGGFIDKYIGDCIMALFPNRPEDAVRAAVELGRELERYNAGRVRAGYAPVRIGVGIHRGPLILGTIGNPRHMQGTVIADAVNVAARLEGLTKTYGAQIIVSDALAAVLGDECRMLGYARVKGKKKRVLIYELFAGLEPAAAARRRETRVDFQAAVGAYFRRDFGVAAELFARVNMRDPGDKAAALYERRCRQFLAEGVAPDWEGLAAEPA